MMFKFWLENFCSTTNFNIMRQTVPYSDWPVQEWPLGPRSRKTRHNKVTYISSFIVIKCWMCPWKLGNIDLMLEVIDLNRQLHKLNLNRSSFISILLILNKVYSILIIALIASCTFSFFFLRYTSPACGK